MRYEKKFGFVDQTNILLPVHTYLLLSEMSTTSSTSSRKLFLFPQNLRLSLPRVTRASCATKFNEKAIVRKIGWFEHLSDRV